jgi:PAS domain S-box-containing protein
MIPGNPDKSISKERMAQIVTHKPASHRIGMEEKLRQSEELHRIILTNISDSVFLTDDRGNFTFICPNVDNIFGYSFDEIYAMKNIDALLGPKLFDSMHLDRTREIRNFEREALDKRGNPHTLLISVKAVDIMYGTRLFTCRDITEYKRIESEMVAHLNGKRALEKDLALFFTLSADLFCILDARRFKKLNPAWSKCLGWKGDELIGSEALGIVHPDDRHVTKAALQNLKAGQVVDFENRCRHRDGRYRWISWSGTMSDDGLVHAVGRDITAKRQEEDEMRRRLLTYRVETGRTYMVPEKYPLKLTGVFSELLSIHQGGVILSRRRCEDISPVTQRPFEYLWFSERDGKGTVRPEPAAVERLLDGLPSDSVILLDSLDYLIAKCGFKSVLDMVNHIVEIAFFRNMIILLGMDPECVAERDVKKLARDTLALEPYPRPELSQDSLDMLQAVYRMNIRGSRPTRTELCQALSLSHPTVRSRIRDMVSVGLLWESGSGRSVVVEITEAGRQAINMKGSRGEPTRFQ